MNYKKCTLIKFLDELGSASPAPGGGSAAAVTATLGTALVEMTSRLNDKRLGRSSGTALKAAALRAKLQELVAKDAAAFENIRKIFKIKKEKPAAWQSALKAGAKVPLLICEHCVGAAGLAKREKARTGAWLESDRKEARVLLRAAFDAANLNVEINLKEISDSAFCSRTRREIKKWRSAL